MSSELTLAFERLQLLVALLLGTFEKAWDSQELLGRLLEGVVEVVRTALALCQP